MQSRSSQMLMKTGADIFCINVIIQELTPSQIGMLERSRPFAGVSGSVHFQKKKYVRWAYAHLQYQNVTMLYSNINQ